MAKIDSNSRAIFLHAETFAIAADMILENFKKTIDRTSILPIEPQVVLSAFSFELYLKCLISVEDINKVPRDSTAHSHRALFDLVSPYAQIWIETRWNEHTQTIYEKKIGQTTDFMDVLTRGSKAFVKVRYLFEPAQWKDCEFRSGQIRIATRDYLIKHHPELLTSD